MHRNAEAFAIQYHSTQLGYQMLLTWRIQLRDKLKMMKKARMAEKFLAARRAWRVWKGRLDEKRREKKLKEFEKQRVQKYFEGTVSRFFNP